MGFIDRYFPQLMLAFLVLCFVGLATLVPDSPRDLRDRCTVALASADALDSLRVYVVQPQCVEGR